MALRLSATSMTTAEVAAHLGIGPDVVRERVLRIMAALGAPTKFDAVLLALRLGLIDLPAE